MERAGLGAGPGAARGEHPQSSAGPGRERVGLLLPQRRAGLRSPQAAMGERKAVIKNADMSEEMQQDSVECATQALEKYNIEKDIAAHIKKVSPGSRPRRREEPGRGSAAGRGADLSPGHIWGRTLPALSSAAWLTS